MAFSTSTHSFFNFKLSSKTAPPLHQPKKKPVTLLLNPRFAPPLLSSCNQCFRANSVTFSNPSTPRHGFSVGSQPDYSSGDDGAQSFIPEATQQEEFSWKSVILPSWNFSFVFPALGGLLFGYDIGATSSATLSLQSPELSGTAWFKLSAIQLGLVGGGGKMGERERIAMGLGACALLSSLTLPVSGKPTIFHLPLLFLSLRSPYLST
ncbi:hypothetical protein DVH24_032944 [Malus domestica]|uniref:Major facilitator superfamily (MFS) profile domain-containing protein n=1 Tax=Malus domestica TaxID=3750 RepID=A0A498IN45_MALDO|nr:hypothetical protein DVH24_032944 [Malus domestica]